MKQILVALLILIVAVPAMAQVVVGVNRGTRIQNNLFPDCSSQAGLTGHSKNICVLGDSIHNWQSDTTDACNVATLIAFMLDNQTENRSEGMAALLDTSDNCMYLGYIEAIIWCSYFTGTETENSQFGDSACEGSGNCDWVVLNGGGWDLSRGACTCANEAACTPCDSEDCVAQLDAIADNDLETGYLYSFLTAARANSSGVKFVISGYYLQESAVAGAYNGCLSALNDRYEHIAGDELDVWFVDNETLSDHEDHDDFIHTDGVHPLKKYRCEIAARIAQIIATEEGW